MLPRSSRRTCCSACARWRPRRRRGCGARSREGMLELDPACGRYACCRAGRAAPHARDGGRGARARPGLRLVCMREMQAAALELYLACRMYAFWHASLPGHVFLTDVQFVLDDHVYVFALKACSDWYIRILVQAT